MAFKSILNRTATATILAGSIASATPHAQPSPDWFLLWSDEFDGPSLDREIWEPLVGDGCDIDIDLCGWGNGELQYYTGRPVNVRVAGGLLILEAREEPFQGRAFTSARIRTANNRDWRYGRVEVRARLPTDPGLWPAIWMLPTDFVYGPWPLSGEIDIVEVVGLQPDTAHASLHFGGPGRENLASRSASWSLPSGSFSDAHHVFALEWERDEMRWYVDDRLYLRNRTWGTGQGSPYPAPFDQRFHLLLNIAVGGDWPGPPTAATEWPQIMEVDYVRVWKPTLHTVPTSGATRIEAEDFAVGGPGAGYRDLTRDNLGGFYRTDDSVDIEPCSDAGGGYNVGWITRNEWLRYSVRTTAAGSYRARIRVAAPSATGAFRFQSEFHGLGSPVTVPATGDWQEWRTVTIEHLPLAEGRQWLQFLVLGDGFNLNWIELERNDPQQDSDADGLPDVWELEHFGSRTAAVPSADPDLDASDNHSEFVADTDPNDRASFLGIAGTTFNGESLVVRTASSSARVYVLESARRLRPEPDWTPHAPPMPGTGEEMSWSVPPTDDIRFFRIVARLP